MSSEYTLIHCTGSYTDLFQLDELITNQNKDSSFYIVKNLVYYKNRYLEHPQQLYQCYLIQKKDDLVGFVVFKEFKDHSIKKGHLIDFVKLSTLTHTELINITFDYFKDNVDVVSFWPINKSFKDALDNIEYPQEGFDTFFAIKFLDKEFRKSHNSLLEFDSWELMMGDSDAF